MIENIYFSNLPSDLTFFITHLIEPAFFPNCLTLINISYNHEQDTSPEEWILGRQATPSWVDLKPAP